MTNYNKILTFSITLLKDNNPLILDAIRIARDINYQYHNVSKWKIKASVLLRATSRIYPEEVCKFLDSEVPEFKNYQEYDDAARFYEASWRIDNLKHLVVTRSDIDMELLKEDIKIIKSYYNE